MMPREEGRAKALASLGYGSVKPVVQEMLRWLRTDPSPVADVFIEFFATSGTLAADEVGKALSASRQENWERVLVTRVLPKWPREAMELLTFCLALLVTNSGEPETALMALLLLAKHELQEKPGYRYGYT